MTSEALSRKGMERLAALDMRDAFFDEVYRIALEDSSVIFLTDDMDAFSLRRFKQEMPNQFLNIGVAEQNLINLASGLAMSGKKVFAYGIAPFVTMRCFEQLKVNVCSMNLPVTIVGVGAGFSFEFDGPTHHGIHDVAVMRTLPEMTIYNPSDAATAESIAREVYRSAAPAYVRIDKGAFPVLSPARPDIAAGFRVLRPKSEVTVVATGYMTSRISEILRRADDVGSELGLVDLFRVKPLSNEFHSTVVAASDTIITVEESAISGGIGTAVAELIAESGMPKRLIRLGVEDRQFIQYGSREWFHEINGIDDDSLLARFRGVLAA